MDDQIVATNLERTPSLLDGLESGWYVEGGVAARYQFAVDLDCYLATPGVAGSPMADEMRVAIELPDEGLRALPDVAGLAGRVRDFLRPRREQVTGRQQFELPLVAYELWVPPVTGATASATIRSPITRGLQPCRRCGRPPRRSSAYGCLRRLLSAAPACPRSPGDAQGRGRAAGSAAVALAG
jgi:hypothetical protein